MHIIHGSSFWLFLIVCCGRGPHRRQRSCGGEPTPSWRQTGQASAALRRRLRAAQMRSRTKPWSTRQTCLLAWRCERKGGMRGVLMSMLAYVAVSVIDSEGNGVGWEGRKESIPEDRGRAPGQVMT